MDAVFSSDACKEGEICPEMHSIAKLTNIPKYLLLTKITTITKITHEASQDALPLFRKLVLIVIILSVNNMKEGFFFGFKGLTRAEGDLFYSLSFLLGFCFCCFFSFAPML